MQLHPLRLGRASPKPPRGLRRVSFSDEQPRATADAQGAAWLAGLRLEPVQAAALEHVLDQRADLAAQLDASSAHLRAWVRRREKRTAQPGGAYSEQCATGRSDGNTIIRSDEAGGATALTLDSGHVGNTGARSPTVWNS